jgi:hypothetical protein
MSWHFLQGSAEASWEGTCLDGAPAALSSSIPIAGEFCSHLRRYPLEGLS